jgi:hypothetical protein
VKAVDGGVDTASDVINALTFTADDMVKEPSLRGGKHGL